MRLDQRTKKRLIAEETSRLIDSQFGQLDLSGSPDLQNPMTESFATQKAFASDGLDIAIKGSHSGEVDSKDKCPLGARDGHFRGSGSHS